MSDTEAWASATAAPGDMAYGAELAAASLERFAAELPPDRPLIIETDEMADGRLTRHMPAPNTDSGAAYRAGVAAALSHVRQQAESLRIVERMRHPDPA